MNKKIVYQQMKEENKGGDECDRSLEDHRYAIAYRSVVVTCCSYFVYANLFLPKHDESSFLMIFPLTIGFCSYYFIKFRDEHKKRYVLAFLIFLSCAFAGIIQLLIMHE